MDLIPIPEAATLAKVSSNTLRNYQRAGKLTEYKQGTRVMVDRQELLTIFSPVRTSKRDFNDTRVYAITNQKGGVGKTTTASNLGYLLSLRGPTLLIDADHQANLTVVFGVNPEAQEYTLYHVLADGLPLSNAILRLPAPFEGIDIVAGDLLLSGITPTVYVRMGWETLLKDALAPVLSQYQYVVIDCPPNLDVLTLNALVAATDVIVPVEMGTLSLRGTAQLFDTIQSVSKRNPNLTSPRFLATRLDNTRVTATILEQLQKRYGDLVLTNTIRNATVVGKSQINRRPLALEDPAAPAARDYEGALEELLNG